MLAGKILDGTAVAGMTKMQVRLAMRADPDQFTTFNGQEAWVYFRGTFVRKRPLNDDTPVRVAPGAPAPGQDPLGAGSGFEGHKQNTRNNAADNPSSESYGVTEKNPGTRTTILFLGDKAVRADITRD